MGAHREMVRTPNYLGAMHEGGGPGVRGGTTAEKIAEGLSEMSQVLERHFANAADRRGLSATQARMLTILGVDGSMRARDLADRLGVGLPTISDSVRVCVRKGLVTRNLDPDDTRARRLSLTPAGHYEADATTDWRPFLLGAVGALSSTEQDAFLAALVKVVAALQRAAEPPGTGPSPA